MQVQEMRVQEMLTQAAGFQQREHEQRCARDPELGWSHSNLCDLLRVDVPWLAHEVLRLREEIARRRLCGVCWQDAWTPVESEADCELTHPHPGVVHARCECCWLETVLRGVRAQYAQLRECWQWALERLGAHPCNCPLVFVAHEADCPYARALTLLEEKP